MNKIRAMSFYDRFFAPVYDKRFIGTNDVPRASRLHDTTFQLTSKLDKTKTKSFTQRLIIHEDFTCEGGMEDGGGSHIVGSEIIDNENKKVVGRTSSVRLDPHNTSEACFHEAGMILSAATDFSEDTKDAMLTLFRDGNCPVGSWKKKITKRNRKSPTILYVNKAAIDCSLNDEYNLRAATAGYLIESIQETMIDGDYGMMFNSDGCANFDKMFYSDLVILGSMVAGFDMKQLGFEKCGPESEYMFMEDIMFKSPETWAPQIYENGGTRRPQIEHVIIDCSSMLPGDVVSLTDSKKRAAPEPFGNSMKGVINRKEQYKEIQTDDIISHDTKDKLLKIAKKRKKNDIKDNGGGGGLSNRSK